MTVFSTNQQEAHSPEYIHLSGIELTTTTTTTKQENKQTNKQKLCL
jgi:hypothetical protein